MKIFLKDQTSKFSKHLYDLKSTPVMPYNKSLLTEKTSSVSLNLNFSHVNFDPFFNYEIFPGRILTFRSQWQEEGRKMRVGDTIIQQVYLPPSPIFSQKVIFGVRICDIVDDTGKKGFSYETLEGHVEKGISTFTIEKAGDRCIFRIHTFSQPGNFLSKILGPVFSVPYQTFCTKAALRNVKRRLEGKTGA